MQNWTLYYLSDCKIFLIIQYLSELIDKLVIYNIPELKFILSSEYQLINISGRMHHDLKISIELFALNFLPTLNIENDELSILS